MLDVALLYKCCKNPVRFSHSFNKRLLYAYSVLFLGTVLRAKIGIIIPTFFPLMRDIASLKSFRIISGQSRISDHVFVNFLVFIFLPVLVSMIL